MTKYERFMSNAEMFMGSRDEIWKWFLPIPVQNPIYDGIHTSINVHARFK
jgi:hypothetical protein